MSVFIIPRIWGKKSNFKFLWIYIILAYGGVMGERGAELQA